ncbi:FK506-binding protein 5-like [Ornithodoros turicata]|uniref:FK506-binding protein 5-like n=1 Tax=Ornithodoros turicata TaxID=34597 RepID=UPI003139EA06
MRACLFVLLGLFALCPAPPVPEGAERTVAAGEEKAQPALEFKEGSKEDADSAFQTMLDSVSEDRSKDERDSSAAVEQLSAILEFAKYDSNKDGFIDLGEWSSIHGGIEKFKAHFHSADVDGDKQIAELEFQAAPWYNEADPVVLPGELVGQGDEAGKQYATAEGEVPQFTADQQVPQVLQDVPVPSQNEGPAEPEDAQEPVPELRYASEEAEDPEQEPMILLTSADNPEVTREAAQEDAAHPEEGKDTKIQEASEGKDASDTKQTNKVEVNQVRQPSEALAGNVEGPHRASTEDAKQSETTNEKQKAVEPEGKVEEQEKTDARTF